MIIFEHKNCLVTEAAHGTGRAISENLARQGANLFLVAIDESAQEGRQRWNHDLM